MRLVKLSMVPLLALSMVTVIAPTPAQAALDDVLKDLRIDVLFDPAESYKNSVNNTPTAISGREYEPYEFSYFYNIGAEDFASIRLRWEQKADTDIVASLGSGSQNRNITVSESTPTNNISFSELTIEAKNFCTSAFVGGLCPAGSEAPKSTLNLEVQRGGVTQRTYQFEIVRRLASDTTRFRVWTAAEPLSPSWDAGEPPADEFFFRGYVQVPSANTMEKAGYYLAGWKSADLSATYPIESYFYLDQDLELVPDWQADTVSGLVEIEGGPEIDPDPLNPTNQYGAFDDQTPETIELGIEASRLSVELYSYPGDSADPLDSIDTQETARNFLNVTGPCVDPNHAECSNLFRLEMTFHSGSGESSRTINVYLLRQTDPNLQIRAPIRFEGSEVGAILGNQGWVQFPANPPDGVPAFTPLTRLRGSPLGVTQDFLPGEYAPVFSDQAFEILELVLEPQVEIFGEAMMFGACPDVDGFCLNFDQELYYPDGDSFFITIDASQMDLDDPSDDATQTLKVDWFEDPSATVDTRSAWIESQDHRFEDFVYLESDVEDLAGVLPDSFLCEAAGCHRAWWLRLYNEISDTQLFEYSIYFVLAPSGGPFDIDFALDSSAEPNRTMSEPFGWLELPASNIYSKPDFEFRFWTSENNTLTRFDQSYVPVLENDKIFGVWRELFQIRFMNEGDLIVEEEIVSDQLLGDFSVTLPASDYDFLGWSLERGGAVLPDDYNVTTDTTLFAIWDIPPAPEAPPVFIPRPVVISPPVLTPPEPESPEEPLGPQPIKTKTYVEISHKDGMTYVEAVVPAKYVNKSARIEIRRVIGGKVRYYLIGKAWTHYDRKRNDFTKAAMTFRFPLELKPDDVIRVKVRGVQVIRATGEGKPAWR